MSWSTYTVGTAAEIKDRVLLLDTPAAATFQPTKDQLDAAKAAAAALIDSGAVGAGNAFSVTLSGHATEGHALQESSGFANDVVSVSVVQVAQASVDQYDANVKAQQLAQE